MSKLMTDSEVLMDLLFEGTAYNDTPLYGTIEDLKKCAFDCMEMRITGYMLSDEQKEKLDGFTAVFVETCRMLSSLQNDFNDLIEEHFKEQEAQYKNWKEKFKKGGAE